MMTDTELQAQKVRRRLVDKSEVDKLLLVAAWGAFDRETIADAIVICRTAVEAHKLFLEWKRNRIEQSMRNIVLPEVSLLAYLRRRVVSK